MKNKIKYIILSVFISFAIISCSEDFLNIDPEQNIPAEKAVVSENTLKTALNGVYSELQGSDYYGRSFYVIPELMADNLFLSSRNTGRYLDFDNFVVSEEDSYVEGLWDNLYVVLVNASHVIEGGEKLEGGSQEQQALFDQLVGEAYALRALAHFDLVRMFAQPYNFTADASHPGIPIINQVNDERISPSRDNVQMVYEQINSDLASAIIKMTASKNEGRFSVNAAHALAARVALYQEDYEAAISHSTVVIESGEFSLIGNAEYSSLWATDFNKESIFEIINTISDSPGFNSLGHFFVPDGYADALVPEDLINTYDPDDVRLSVIIAGTKSGAEEVANFVGKFPKGTSHDDNIKVLRMAEQYLIRAEAYAKTNKDDLASEDLQAVVIRANPDASPVTETGEDLIAKILLERRKELAFEGQRLFDLNRNKMDVEIVQGENVIQATYPNEKFILPIPLSELNANTNMQQNPGY
jgi:hypothetical protein